MLIDKYETPCKNAITSEKNESPCRFPAPASPRRSNMQQLIVSALLASLWTLCTGSGDWCYQTQFSCAHQCNAPEKWNQANSNCGGKSQSPINIVTRKTLKDERLTPFKFDNYQQTFSNPIKNNGHSVQVAVPQTRTISGGQLPTTYKAVQFHLHWGTNGGPGSEHTIDGEQYPMELHIVHMKQHYADLTTALADPEGVAVLGFFYERSNSANKKYEPIINALKSIKNTNGNTSLSSISLSQLIPAEQNLTSYYRYKGSLTTPGCTEAVIWTLFENPIPLSMEQLLAFSELKFQDGKSMVGTFRPVQPLNGRKVYRSGGAVMLASSTLLMLAITTALGFSQPN
ncbi:carbonic anhydrase 4-like [Xyrichtys novacula]|uniref:Carbonic anhydrase n=1 Tax=Xyrichtys novacula TaxID=13765 RepID=A0AAV1FSE1_XYRNO|nr:carbonic anhydrase 4-like [Xyrichtys novacula]